MIIYPSQAQGCLRMETNKANVKKVVCKWEKREEDKSILDFIDMFRKVIYMRVSFFVLHSVLHSFRSVRSIAVHVSGNVCCWFECGTLELCIHLNCYEMSKYNEIYLSRAHVRCQKGKVPSLIHCIELQITFSSSPSAVLLATSFFASSFSVQMFLLTPVHKYKWRSIYFHLLRLLDICAIEVQRFWTLHSKQPSIFLYGWTAWGDSHFLKWINNLHIDWAMFPNGSILCIGCTVIYDIDL